MTGRLRTNFPTRELGREVDYDAIKRHAFSDHGVLVVDVNDPRLSWVDREEVKRIGMKLHGPQGQR